MTDWQGDLKDLAPVVRARAARVLGNFGPAALPSLTQALSDTDPLVRLGATEALARLGSPATPALGKALRDSDRRVKKAAIDALMKLRPPDEKLVPALLALHNDAEFQYAAIYILSGIGAPAVPALAEALAQKDSALRPAAVTALGQIGPPAAGPLLQAAGDSDTRIRQIAVSSLHKLTPATKQAVPALIKALADSDPYVRRGPI